MTPLDRDTCHAYYLLLLELSNKIEVHKMTFMQMIWDTNTWDAECKRTWNAVCAAYEAVIQQQMKEL